MRLYFLISALASVALFSCKNEPKAPDWNTKTIQLSCAELEGSETAPAFAVYLQVDERKTKIAEINSACNTLAREEMPAYEIPEDAISAIGGWWAGSGDYFYTVAEGEVIAVYQGYADEMQEEPGYHYQRIATYDGKKFNITRPDF